MHEKKSHYLPALDGIRALSILLVLIAHVGFEKQVPGGLGVNVFFFISGFLITNLLLTEFAKHGKINFKNFFTRRILRLYPPLLVMIIAVCCIPVLNQRLATKEILAAVFYWENYYCIQNFYLLLNNVLQTRFRIIWSLAIEEHFYLVFPFLFALFAKQKKLLIGATSAIILLALLHRIYIASLYHASPYADNYTYQATTCRADSIMMGCLCSIIIYVDVKRYFIKFASLWPVFIGSFALIILTLLKRDEFFRQTFRYSLQSLACMFIVTAILYDKKFEWLNRLLSLRPATFVGKISYSLYLFHTAFFAVEAAYITNKIGSPLYVAVGLAGAFVLALMSYYIVEKPIMSLRRRFGSEAGKNTNTVSNPPTSLPVTNAI